jgi:hypothetical protein
MKHTPGPWTQHTPSNPTQEAVVIVRELPNYRRTVVAVIPDHRRQGNAAVTDWTEEHANARLIAAAPDLLELAAQIVLAADQREAAIPADIVAGARAAIRTATGE